MSSQCGVMDRENFLWRLFRSLTDLRLSNDPHGLGVDAWAEFYSLVNRGLNEGYVSAVEFIRLNRLARNAALHSTDSRFPDVRNAGPYMPTSVWFKRHKTALEAKPVVTCMGGYDFVDASQVKLQAQGSANEESQPVPTPAAPRQLRLLCLLAKPKLGATQARRLPVHTLHRVPPRTVACGRWADLCDSCLVLREAHAVEPTAEVLARCERHRQTHALRASARTVRTGGVSA